MSSDLHWLAYRYVADEMSNDEREAFESRLAEDQAAREAVAASVELIGAVVMAERLAPAARTRRPRVRTWYAAAACLALAVGGSVWALRPRTPGVPGVVARPQMPTNGAVALAWSGLQASGEDESPASSDLIAWIDEPVNATDGSMLSSADESSLPGWLVEAAALRGTSPQNGVREN